MAYGVSYEVPADAAMYQRVKGEIGDAPPKGLLFHLVVETPGGLRHVGVWESESDWQRFRDERSRPAVHRVLAAAGFRQMPPDPAEEQLKLVDVWVP